MEEVYKFPRFELDLRTGWLSRDGQLRALRPKTFALLSYLVARPGQLVTKRELLQALWPDVVVGDAALTVCVHELRDTFGDDSRHPRYIETQHGKGYRFIAPVTWAGPSSNNGFPSLDGDDAFFVGRDEEIGRLLHSWHQASAGLRQVVLIAGEPGIGKTTLVDRFLNGLQPTHRAVIGRGQCLQLFGDTEPYHPLREALAGECRTSEGVDLKEILRRYAPAWAADMPGVIESSELEAVRIEAGSASHPRMLREMAFALEAFTETRPLVLVLEDLHLSDLSTAQLLVYLAQRRAPAHLLIIATCRSGESDERAKAIEGIIRQLRRSAQFEKMRLGPLNASAVAKYVRARFRGDSVPAGLVGELYRRTEGHPLFMVGLTEDLLSRDGSRDATSSRHYDRRSIPETTRQLIESQFDALAPRDQQLLESASIAGIQFTPAELASVHHAATAAIEKRCEGLARSGRFIRRAGISSWPDGTTATRYTFQHGLYQEFLYDRIGAARRAQLHRRIGSRVEAAHGSRAPEVASELAMHFERGRDFSRAARYQHILAETALRLSANDAAIAHAEKAISSLEALPQNRERSLRELQLQVLMVSALMARWGMGAKPVERAYRHADELIGRLGRIPAVAPLLLGMAKFHLVRSELEHAHRLAESCLELATSSGDRDLLLEAHLSLASILYRRGESRTCLQHCQQALALYDSNRHRSHALLYGVEPGVLAEIYSGFSLWHLGLPDQSRNHLEAAVVLAEKQGHAHSLSMALTGLTSTYQRCCFLARADSFGRRLIAYTEEKELPQWHAWGQVIRGMIQVGLAQFHTGTELMRAGLAELSGSGTNAQQLEARTLLPRVRARTLGRKEALRMAQAALAASLQRGDLNDLPEVQRTIGVLSIPEQGRDAGSSATAERWFLEAIETARRQGALSFELRATIDLARLWARQGSCDKARDRLSEVYSRFTEGFDTGDLKEARALLEDLPQRSALN